MRYSLWAWLCCAFLVGCAGESDDVSAPAWPCEPRVVASRAAFVDGRVMRLEVGPYEPVFRDGHMPKPDNAPSADVRLLVRGSRNGQPRVTTQPSSMIGRGDFGFTEPQVLERVVLEGEYEDVERWVAHPADGAPNCRLADRACYATLVLDRDGIVFLVRVDDPTTGGGPVPVLSAVLPHASCDGGARFYDRNRLQADLLGELPPSATLRMGGEWLERRANRLEFNEDEWQWFGHGAFGHRDADHDLHVQIRHGDVCWSQNVLVSAHETIRVQMFDPSGRLMGVFELYGGAFSGNDREWYLFLFRGQTEEVVFHGRAWLRWNEDFQLYLPDLDWGNDLGEGVDHIERDPPESAFPESKCLYQRRDTENGNLGEQVGTCETRFPSLSRNNWNFGVYPNDPFDVVPFPCPFLDVDLEHVPTFSAERPRLVSFSAPGMPLSQGQRCGHVSGISTTHEQVFDANACTLQEAALTVWADEEAGTYRLTVERIANPL